MDYLKGNNFANDFATRTLYNLRIIQEKHGNEAYEVTQLINSLLGLIVFPKERSSKYDPKTISDFLPYVEFSDKNNDTKRILNNLRHAVSHSHIFFEKDTSKKNNGQIKTVIFVNCNDFDTCSKNRNNCKHCKLDSNSKIKPNFIMKIPVEKLRELVIAFAESMISKQEKKEEEK